MGQTANLMLPMKTLQLLAAFIFAVIEQIICNTVTDAVVITHKFSFTGIEL
jgi:hypothetical protein